jgi:hypothetical protein
MMAGPDEARPMTADPHAVPAALAAFLRGVERRGAVLAQLQGGDALAGDAALAAAMRAFRAGAPAQPMAEWPQRFWTLLLATPQMRQPSLPAHWPDELAWLGGLQPSGRAALLLRLAAGLPEAEAAAVLGVAPASYRLALRRALPHREDGRADPGAWARLRESVHRRIKTLPAERLAHLARLREAALGGAALAERAPPRGWPRWLRPLLWILLAGCALALAATWLWPWWQQRGADAQGIVHDRLRAQAPAARYDAKTGLLSHRDFELLADPEGEAQARELAFFSWLAAQAPTAAAAGKASSAGLAAGAAAPARIGDEPDGRLETVHEPR